MTTDLAQRVQELEQKVARLERLVDLPGTTYGCPECTGNGFPYPGILYDPTRTFWSSTENVQRCDTCRVYTSDNAALLALLRKLP